MSKETQKKLIIIVCVVLAVALVWGIIQYQQNQQHYERTHVTINDTVYQKDITTLDLSGQTILEVDGIKELTNLETLDLRNTGITLEQYDALHAALPACDINWSVPFRDGYIDSTISELTLENLSEEDLQIITYLPKLQTLNTEDCRAYPVIMQLIERYPDL